MLVVLVTGICILPKPAAAHVLVIDEAKTVGAILHINPDDDPIAGESSQLIFDIQSRSITNQTHETTLKITDNQGRAEEVPAKLTGSTASATYTFPAQGIYRLELTALAKDENDSLTFAHTQRVSRGVAGSALDEPSHAWAEIALIASACSFFVLLIVGFNRRKEIAVYSKW